MLAQFPPPVRIFDIGSATAAPEPISEPPASSDLTPDPSSRALGYVVLIVIGWASIIGSVVIGWGLV